MKSMEFVSACRELGLQCAGNEAFGIVGDWPVRVLNQSGIFVRVITDNAEKDKIKALRALVKGKGSVSYEKKLVAVYLRIKKFGGSLSDAVRECVKALDTAGLIPAQECPYCGRSGCDTAAHYKSDYRTVHRSCLQNAFADSADKAEQSKQKGSYILGFIGALIGMLIGTIPSLLTIIFMEMEYALLFALIPICAYFGYRFFNGRMNKAALIVTILMAIVGVYVMMFEWAAFVDYVNYGLTLGDAVLDFLGYLMVLGNWALLTGDCLVEFLFAAIGVWVSWRIISRTPESVRLEAGAVLELAVPYPAGSEPAFEAEEAVFTGYDEIPSEPVQEKDEV